MQANEIQTQPQAATLDQIESLDNFQKKHSNKFTRGQLIWFVRNRSTNGLSDSGAVILSARKFYINEPLFAAWFASQKA